MTNGNKTTRKSNRFTRYISKEIKLLKRTKTYVSNRSGFLISDSKSKDLHYLNCRKYINFFYKGGTEIDNHEIQSYAKHICLNKRIKYPVLLFWFGTCSFTRKTNTGLFEVKDKLESVVDDVITSYRETKTKLKNLNPRAKLVFLECPYYSLSMFNLHRRKKFDKDYFIKQQRQLINAIDYHNVQVRALNNIKNIPNFNNDFSSRVKCRKRQP